MKHTNTDIVCSEFADSAEHLVEDAQELIAATAHIAEEKVMSARKRLAVAVESCRDAWSTVQESAASGARAADQAVRDHPYQSIGIALGAGLLLGLLARGRK
jgi:ElaB/YqjD/DUF883 family membrane-anchored ribosome-binding protein